MLLPHLLWASTFIVLSTSGVFDALIYKDLHPHGYCVRRFNATSEMGCGSSGTGLVYDADSYLGGVYPVEGNVILLMQLNVFYAQTTQDKIVADPKIRGILLYDLNSTGGTPISDDSDNPNCKYGLYGCDGSTVWNPAGTSTFFRAYPFPIMLLRVKDDIVGLTQCMQKHRGRCYAQMDKEMHAVGNSVICMRRNKIHHLFDFDFGAAEGRLICVPASRSNIRENVGQSRQNASLVLVTRSDTVSLFPHISSGFGSPGSGLLVLLSCAKQISAHNVSVSVLIFGTESLDYSGSTQYLLKDEFRWKDVIEIGQMAFSDKMFLHSDTRDDWDSELKERNERMMGTFLREPGFARGTSRLPPSSVQNLLKHRQFSHLFVSDYDTTYRNPFYHSCLDVVAGDHNVTLNRFTRQSQAISRALLNWTGVAPQLEDNRKFVTDMYLCMFVSMNCSLLRRLALGFNLSVDFNSLSRPMNFYPFGNEPDFVMLSLLTRYATARYESLGLSRAECLKANGAFVEDKRANVSLCIVGSDFSILDATPSEFSSDAGWPLWTESVEGHKLVARYFLRFTVPSWLPLLLGVAATIITTPCIALIRR